MTEKTAWLGSNDVPRPDRPDRPDRPGDLAAIIDKAAALDLLEQWLDVHPERSLHQLRKVNGKVLIDIAILHRDKYPEVHSSSTRETLASAIRTVLGIAYANGDK